MGGHYHIFLSNMRNLSSTEYHSADIKLEKFYGEI